MPFQPLGPSINPKLSSLSAILKQADEDIEQFISWQSTIKPPRLHRPSVPQRQQSFSRELHLVSKRKTLRNITNTIQASSATPQWQKIATNAKSRPPARLSANQRSQSDDSINTTTSHQSVPALFTSDVTSSSLPPSSSVGRLWSSGLNIAQQLGLRHYTDFSRYQPVKFLTDGEQNKRFLVDARLLACGAMSSYAVDQSGRLWSWGSNDDAALGVRCAGNSEADSAPIIVPLPFNNTNDESSEQIKQLAAGCSFVAVLTTQGRLFIWGTWIDEDTGDKQRISDTPAEVRLSMRVERMVVGNSHLLALTANGGRVFAMGWNGCAQLTSQRSKKFITRPMEITSMLIPKGYRRDDCLISNVFAASNSSWCELQIRRGLTDVYQYFAWGSNTHGQLGIGSISVDSGSCAAVLVAKPLRKSASSSTVASSNSAINSVDNNSQHYPAIGAHQRFAFVSTPVKIKEHFYAGRRIMEITGGLDFTGFLLDSGRLFTCGRGDFGQLGIVDAYRHVVGGGQAKVFICSRPKPVCYQVSKQWPGHALAAQQTDKTIKASAAAAAETALLPDRRRAAMRCRKQISPLVHISAGSRSITAVTADGRLLVWGDNYSGQLGLGNSPADPSVPLYPGVYFPTVLPFKNVSRCSGVQVGSNHTIICAK